jgi:hypothetical protein
MVLSLIYGKFLGKYEPIKIGTITFDNTISEEYRFNSRVTSYPVEQGTLVQDHIINLPETVVLSGLVTDTPLFILSPFNRSIDVFNQLIALHEQRAVVQVQTGLRLYPKMAITSLDIPRTVKTGQTLTFNIELQRIIFSDVLSTFIDPTNIQAGTQINRSSQIIADSKQIPFIQADPPNTLKDQASTTVNVGVQTTDSIPRASLPNFISNAKAIAGP